MKKKYLLTLILLFVFTVNSNAAPRGADSKHLGTVTQQQIAREWNQQHTIKLHDHWTPLRPFSEVEQTGYVVTNTTDAFEMAGLREAIAKNLPKGVTFVLYVTDASQSANFQSLYSPYLTNDQLKFVLVPDTGDSIWARDSLPFPVYLTAGSPSTPATFGLVASIYPQNFDPNAAFASALQLPRVNTQQYFRGGNLLFDLNGNCFTENANETSALTDAQTFFKEFYGCRSVTVLPYTNGLGDIDERLKFLTGNIALTDNVSYQTTLAARGYDVRLIPTTGNDNETYMNTLYVNGTIFVPQMGVQNDSAALAAYRALGMKAVGVYTKTMADQGDGNIHCVTMNYPQGTFVPSAHRSGFLEFRK